MNPTLRARLARTATTLAAFFLGLYIFKFERGFLRIHFSDALVTFFIYFFLRSVGMERRGRAALLTATIFCLTEGLQAMRAAERLGVAPTPMLHLTLGATFDPVDFLCYVAGLLAALAFDRLLDHLPGGGA